VTDFSDWESYLWPGTTVLPIHRHLFGDVYEWAGKLRTAPMFPTSMVKGGPSPESIAAGEFDADDQYPYRYYPTGEGMLAHLETWFARLNEPTDYDKTGVSHRVV